MANINTFTANLLARSESIVLKPRRVLYLIGFFIAYEIGISIGWLFNLYVSPLLILSLLTFLLIILKVITARRIPAIPLLGWWVVFALLAVITYARSSLVVGPVQGTWVVFRLAFAGALIYPAFWFFLTKKEHLQTFLTIMALSAALSGLIAVIQTISSGILLSGVMTNDRFLGFLTKFPPETLGTDPAVLRAHFYINTIFRGHGTFYRANGFGAFMSIMIGLTWGLFRQARGRRQIFFGLLLGAQLAGLIATFSRTAWAAAIAAIAIAIFIETFFWGKRQLTRRQIQLFFMSVFFGALVLVIALQSNAAADRLNSLLNPGQVAEVQWRVFIWKRALESIIAQPWFGTGIATVVSNEPLIGKGDFGAHNLFVGLAFERGLPALFIFLFLMGRFFTATWRSLRSEQALLPEKGLATGVFASGVAFLLVGMGSSMLDIENLRALFWVLLAIAFFPADKNKKK